MAQTTITYSLARPEDAERIVHLIRQGFSEEFLSMTTMGCHGAEEYCRYLIASHGPFSDSSYLVAMLDGDVVGCLELRTTLDSIFINYVCVAPEARAHGVASQLLRSGIETVRTPSHTWLRLDVLHDNAVARGWYERLGFEVDSGTDWYELSLRPESISSGYISGTPQSEVLQRDFGFSQVNVSTRSGRYGVGVLGTKWLRLTDMAVLSDSDAIGIATMAYPDRTLLVLALDDALPSEIEPVANLRARTLRMTLELSRYDAHIQEEG